MSVALLGAGVEDREFDLLVIGIEVCRGVIDALPQRLCLPDLQCLFYTLFQGFVTLPQELHMGGPLLCRCKRRDRLVVGQVEQDTVRGSMCGCSGTLRVSKPR